MTKEKPSEKNLNSSLKQLAEITDWFENQEEIDVEKGLEKIKEAISLIKASKSRLKEIENEFEEIKKDIESEEEEKTDKDSIDS